MPSGGSSNTTTTTRSDPWSGAQPYVTDVLSEAQNLYRSNTPGYYPGSTLAAQSPETQAGIGALASRGMTGSPLLQGAQAQQLGTINGAYNDPNQNAVYNNVASHVLPSVNSQFSAAGRYGSNSHQNQLTDQLTNAFAPYASQNWNAERNRQEAASAGAGSLAGQDFNDINAVLQAGQMRDQYGQQQINADINRFDFANNLPLQKLINYSGLVQGGNVGGTTTSQQPVYNNTLGQLGGLGLGAAGLYGLLNGGF